MQSTAANSGRRRRDSRTPPRHAAAPATAGSTRRSDIITSTARQPAQHDSSSNSIQTTTHNDETLTPVPCPARPQTHTQISPAHTRYVKGMFRRSLRLAQDWYWKRNEYRETCVKIRALFDHNKNISNPMEINALLMATEQLIAANAHPTPFVYPSGYNGTKWERNAPFPDELTRRGVTPFDNYS
ncbi:hypothetical protein BC831DRAFT_398418 [Entophlyctis helioformis]|nr:hypothetical protein BC831DRAFT_398418 [Entophlyctis helioformis]